MRYEEEAVKKLCSAAYQYKYKKTLLKIMAMPLMVKVFNKYVFLIENVFNTKSLKMNFYYFHKSKNLAKSTKLIFLTTPWEFVRWL